MTKKYNKSKRTVTLQPPKDIKRTEVRYDSEYLSKINFVIAKKRGEMPRKYQKLYDRVIAGQSSPREAIKLHCLECNGWVRGEAEQCMEWACPLYQFRPYRKDTLYLKIA